MNNEEQDGEFTWSVTAERAGKTPAFPLDPTLLGALLDHSTTQVGIFGRDHVYQYANQEMLDGLGRTWDQVVGQHLSTVMGTALYVKRYARLSERLFAGETLRWSGWLGEPGQGWRFLKEALVPFAPVDGVVQSVAVFRHDLTELKQRELELADKLQELQASEVLKSAIVDHALAALISTDAKGLIVEFNPSAEAMFGRTRADVLGRPVSEVVMPQRFRAAHEAGMQRMDSGGEARILGKRMEMHALRADGSEFPIEMVLWRTSVHDSVFYTASMVDLTERHNAAEQIERQREALRQSEKLTAMGSLLAGVAHELNNPLAIVMGRASLLEEKCESDDLKADVQRIREAAERCGRIVRTFLNMARSRPSQRHKVGLNEMVHAATDMLHYGYRSHGIELQLQLDPALPEVLADGDQIGQVILNLLVNAQQALASIAGPRRVSVQTGVERAEGQVGVWLRVRDSGQGVSPELHGRVFEPFFTTKPDGMGTGMGLAVSRALAREHGGDLLLETVDVDSSLDGLRGACFRLVLPMNAQPAEDTIPAPLPELEEEPMLARILVVDDEPELTALMRDMLEGAGYEVATAESGAVALELLEMARFDAVVSDLRMPDMDGSALWRELSIRHPSLARRMLFVTGDTLSLDAQKFLRDSRSDSLDKPFSKGDLLAKVAALVS
ncbi:MAG: PAS domain S-box protein [Aquabacterium sp.]|uniref:PAS domain S-box protein n=1 Tax=Aquabacterium sp. TaxID=1872578 RepID=UPI00271D08C7|nr:PAS domain S-box protein [Aquabacterium sp.]MDO9005313.1 PAS domain S-box protein [Aquabacterium sp.]